MNISLKQSLIFIIIIGGILTAVFYARPDSQSPAAVSTSFSQKGLSADKPAHDFGAISMKKGIVRTTFVIKNVQASEVELKKLYTSCMCTEATLLIGIEKEGPFGMPGHGFGSVFSRKLQPNEEAKIEVAFDPAAHGPAGIGKIERQVIVEGPSGVLITVNISANVTP